MPPRCRWILAQTRTRPSGWAISARSPRKPNSRSVVSAALINACVPTTGRGAMTMTPAQIDLWRQAVSEHQRLGFKEAKNGLDRTKLNEYCVAIANEGGGHLILGISDKPSIPLFLTVVRSSCANEVLRSVFHPILDLVEIAMVCGQRV